MSNKGNILAKKTNVRIQKRELSGGSLSRSEIKEEDYKRAIALDLKAIEAKERKSREVLYKPR